MYYNQEGMLPSAWAEGLLGLHLTSKEAEVLDSKETGVTKGKLYQT